MKVGFVQFKPVFGEKEKNVKKSINLIHKGTDADLLVLPELCNTGYVFTKQEEVEDLAEPVARSDSIQAWIETADKTNTYIVAGIAEKQRKNIYYNSAVLVGPKGLVDVYRKIHLFYREKLFFEPGNKPPRVYDISIAKIGIMICFDWIFPELARMLALRGADIICHPANLVLPYALRAMLTRSIENKVFTVTTNRIGVEGQGKLKLKFTGRSQITSPDMKILAKAGVQTEEVAVVEIDQAEARNKNITRRNNLFEDRQTQLYDLRGETDS